MKVKCIVKTAAVLFVTLLLSSCTCKTKVVSEEKSSFWSGFKYDANKAQALYKQNCLMCHGVSGDGKGPAHKAMKPRPRSFVNADYIYGGSEQRPDLLLKLIKEGKAPMPAWGHMPDEDLKQVLSYILKFKK